MPTMQLSSILAWFAFWQKSPSELALDQSPLGFIRGVILPVGLFGLVLFGLMNTF